MENKLQEVIIINISNNISNRYNNQLEINKQSKTNSTTLNGIDNIEVVEPSDVGKLDQNAFLKMMLTQLQHQDPLSPMDTNAFATQMAQFASIEQLTSMNGKLDNIAELLFMSMLPEAPGSGDSVEGETDTDKEDSESTEGTGSEKPNTESEKPNTESEIKKELEMLKSITIRTDFDYNNDSNQDFNDKISELLLKKYY